MQAVIFDMDGLMIDSERLIHQAMIYAGEKLGVNGIDKVSFSTIGTNAVRTRRIYIENYGGNFQFDEAMRLKHEYLDKIIFGEGFPPKKGLYNLLDFLKSNNFKLGVASSTREEMVMLALSKINVTDYFDTIICGDKVKKSKPDPEIFLETAQQLGVNPCECYVLEDSFNGIKAGYSAGMKTVMVPDMIPPNAEILSMVWRCAESLDDVIEIIKNDCSGEKI